MFNLGVILVCDSEHLNCEHKEELEDSICLFGGYLYRGPDCFFELDVIVEQLCD